MTRLNDWNWHISAADQIVLRELRAWEDRKMKAEAERDGYTLILPESSPVKRKEEQ